MTQVASLAGKLALYFDDQPEKTKAIIDFLCDGLHMKVVTSETPGQALRAIQEETLDLIILDVRILGADRTLDGTGKYDWKRYGIHFLDQLRNGSIPGKTPATVPVLVITCVVNTSDVEKLQHLGERDGARYRYIAKPVPRLAYVEQAIRELLAP